MHPVFSSAKNLAIVTGLWFLVSLLLTRLLQAQLSEFMTFFQAVNVLLPWFFIFVFFCVSNFYICIRFPVDKTNFYHVLLVQFGALVCALGLWFALGVVWLGFLNKLSQIDWLALVKDRQTSIAVVAAVIYGFFVMTHYIYLIAKKQEVFERDALEKKLLLSQIELQTIKAATHPHFLYNALNLLASLSLTHPDKVNKLCLQIADFLRYSVNYANKDFVSMNDEIVHIQNYLGIERERYGDRLRVEFLVDENVRPLRIIPMVLFPLVENAIKHGVESLLDGGIIRVKVACEGERVRLCVSNHYDPLGVKAKSTCLGLSALKKRLKASYSSAVSFEVGREEGCWFIVLISIPRVTNEQ